MSKFEMTKDWCLAMAQQEGTREVGAGWVARNPGTGPADGSLPVVGGRVAFGRLIHLLRRKRQYSVEQLAREADVDVADVVFIEEDLHFSPDPRTVYRLASTFGLPQQSLMELAGLATATDSGVREAAIRFAARSESVSKLSPEERSALDAFVADLSANTPKSR